MSGSRGRSAGAHRRGAELARVAEAMGFRLLRVTANDHLLWVIPETGHRCVTPGTPAKGSRAWENTVAGLRRVARQSRAAQAEEPGQRAAG